ncbi:MAG: PQQ-binding-like beta-propeller repeat protein [Candidatus Hydrogenedentes bacterium]|nr:PQQ-binding-like beta-propeller repeat protein [Candidatus Hydrogenedentota bacterium]
MSWDGIEREKGIFTFGEWPARVDSFLAQRVNLLPILDYNPAWDREVSPADEETRDAFANYVARCVAKFKGKLHYWQVWNEPNISFWKPKPNARDYAELLRRSYLAAKNVDPAVKILGFNCSDIDLDFTEQVIRYGGLDYCDILAYQPYRIAPEVGHFEEVDALRELVGRFGPQKPIWFTEMGWATQHFPFAEAPGLDLMAERPARRQCAFLVRYMVIIQAADIEKVLWFSQAADGAGLEDHAQDKKRLSFYAYRHLMQTLDDYKDVCELTPRGAFGRYAYLFTCPSQNVVVTWSTPGPQAIDTRTWGRPRDARDMLGEQIPVPEVDRVPISSEPIYLFYGRGKTPQTATLRVDPSRMWLAPGEETTVTITPTNAVVEAVPESVSITQPYGLWVSSKRLGIAGNAPSCFDVRAPRNAKPSRQALRVRAGDTAWTIEVNVVPRQLWAYQGECKGYLTPVALTGNDGRREVLLAAYDSPELTCLSADGSLAWRYAEPAALNAPPISADIDGDGSTEIVTAVPALQTVLALGGEGVLRWRTLLSGEPLNENPGWSWTHPAVLNVPGAAQRRIVYADNHGMVTCLSNSGETVWQKAVSTERCDKPCFTGDVLGDGTQSIIVSDKAGSVFCLNAAGDQVWRVDTGAEITATPLAGVIRKGEPPSIFVANQQEKLIRISNRGIVEWESPLGGTMDLGAGIALADLDGDGESELVTSTRNHEVLVFDATGHLQWRVETGAQIRSIPVVIDIDEDGEHEILIGSADWLLYCLGPRGDIEWTFNTGNRIDGSPLITDIDGDGHSDIVLPVRGGKVLALSPMR